MKKIFWLKLRLLLTLSVSSATQVAARPCVSSKKVFSVPFIILFASTFFLAILDVSGASSAADKPSTIDIPAVPNISSAKQYQIKNKRKLQRLMLGVYQSRVEADKIAARLRQLGFETWTNPLKEGFMVNAGAFSSQLNLEKAVSRLQKTGLADKVSVVEVEVVSTPSKDIVKVKSGKARSTVFNSKHARVQDKKMEDGYVPQNKYAKLEQEVEALKSQMQSILTKLAQSGQDSKQAEPPASAVTVPLKAKDSTGSSQTSERQHPEEKPKPNDNHDAEKGSRQQEAEESSRELDTFLRGQKVLYKKGEIALEFNLGYTQDTAVNTFGFPPASNDLATTPKLTTRSVDTSLTMRYGIIDNLEIDLTVPYSYFEQENDNQPFNVDTAPVSHRDSVGIGDISGAIRYTALSESGNIPAITLNLNTKTRTGDHKKGLGTGFWSLGGGMSLVKTFDPVVFFGSLGYTAIFEDRGIDLGDQVSYSLGAGYSMNDRVSFTTSLSGGIAGRIDRNGQDIPGSSLDMHSLQFSTTIQLSKWLFVEPFVGFGLTDDASDLVAGLRIPYRFGERFPLPFLTD